MPAPSVQSAILYRALRLAGVTGAAGRTASPDQLADALGSLNALTDYLNSQREVPYTISPATYTLSPPKQMYTIGQDPNGVLVADFNAPRPTHIEQARLVLTSSPTYVYLPLRLVTDKEWATISVPNIPVTIPKVLFCDYNWPLAGLWFWGYPTQANKVELWTWQGLPQFATTSTTVTLPPAYIDALTYLLAARLQDQFAGNLQVPPNPNLEMQGRRMLGRIKALNAPSPIVASADFGAEGGRKGGGDWNYMSGGPA